MTTDVERMLLRLEADNRTFQKAMIAAAGDADRAAQRIERRFQQQNQRVVRSFQTMSDQSRNIIASIGVGFVVREVGQLSDVWTRVGNALSTAGVEASQLAATQDVVADIAVRTNSELEATASLFSRLFRSSGDLGANMGEVLAATELVSKALSGVSQSERASVITQFGQGLSSGRFQGDELRSVLENSRPIAEAIATEFNTTIGNLRELGAQGQLEASRVLRAVIAGAPEIEAAFARTNITIEDSFTRLQTQMARYVGTNETTSGSTRALARLVQFVADNFETLADATVLASTVLAGSFAGFAIARAVTELRKLQITAATTGTALRAIFSLTSVVTLFGGVLAYAATQTNLFADTAQAAATNADRMYAALNVLANLEPVGEEDIEATNRQGEAMRGVAAASGEVSDLATRAATAIDALTQTSGESLENLSTQERLTRALAQSQLEQASATLVQARAAAQARIDTTTRDASIRGLVRFWTEGPEAGLGDDLTEEDRRVIAETQALIRDYDAGIDAIDEGRARLLEATSGSAGGGGGGGGGNSAGAANRQTIEDLQRQADLSLARLRNDEQRVRLMEDSEEIDRRTAAYIEAGAVAALARASAESEVRTEREALNAATTRAVELGDLQDSIEIARIQNNIALADLLTDQYEVQRRTQDIVAQRGIDEAEAADTARRYVELRREALNAERQTGLDRRDLEVELEAARLRGDNRAEAAIRRRLDLQQAIADLQSRGVGNDEAISRAENELAILERADLQGKFRQWFTGGVTAALDGDLDDFFENWIRDRAAAGLENALNQVADILFESFQGILTNVIRGGQDGLGQAVAAVFSGGASAGLNQLGDGATKAGEALGIVLAASAAEAGSKIAITGAIAAASAAKEGVAATSKAAASLAVTSSSLILAKALLAAASAAQVYAASSGGGKSGISGVVTSVIGSILKFGGGKANGGMVSPGNWYNVGERGPERFIPSVPGYIVPNGGFGGGGQPVIVNDNTVIKISGASTAEVAQLRAQMQSDLANRRQQTVGFVREALRRPRVLG